MILRILILQLFSIGIFSIGYASNYVVTSADDAGAETLRSAITSANSNPGIDTISFNISGSGVHTVNLQSSLPEITSPVFIDGYSQAGSVMNNENESFNGIITISINGIAIGSTGISIGIGGDGTQIRGLHMSNFSSQTFHIKSGSSGNMISGCVLGINLNGNAVEGSENKIVVEGANNFIGGYGNEHNNFISGCATSAAIEISGAAAVGNEIVSNYIGWSLDKSSNLGGIKHGISFTNGASNNSAGNSWEGNMNHIAGATHEGISIRDAGTSQINILGNLIINCGGIPIDLEGDGVTTNDAGDSDTGPNELLNFPLITEAFTDNEEAVYAKLYFEGKPFEYYEINWYLVESSNFENHGELNQWLGRTGQNADASGIVDEEFTFGREKQVDPSSEICCTIMEYDANITSEVSSNINLLLKELKVTNISDIVNGDVSSVLNLIDNPGFDGISLREAIMASNNNLTRWGRNHITFDISGPGPHIIQPNSPLPPLLKHIHIDGRSEPDYSSGSPSVRIDGSLAGVGNGLSVEEGYCEISGLSIVNFSGHGIAVSSHYFDLENTFLGVLEDGVTPAGNGGFGLSIQDANNSEIGENINDFCLIADNALGGIQLTGSGTFNTEVKGCLIGVTQLGNNFLGDQPSGIIIENQAHNNLIGLSNLDEGNVICHHSREGILITGAGTSNNTVVSNKIGIGISGSSSIANERGITLSDGASENIIGGANSQLRNYISGNTLHGILIEDNSHENLIIGNYIGTDLTGNGSIGNNGDGIRITNAYDNLIGGNSVEHRNILSGNLDDGVEINGTSAYDNVIRGNLIGIGANGSTNLANGDDGVAIRNGAYQNTIGGLNSGEGNVISFNSDEGILIDVSSNNSIIGNSIGTDLTGELNCGNNGHGIYILNSDANQIGAFGGGNIISANVNNGIFFSGAATADNEVIENVIGLSQGGLPLGNGGNGISLANCSNNIIGSRNSASRNVISDNQHGIILSFSEGNSIIGNFIGTSLDGLADIGNSGIGISIANSAGTNTIGLDDDYPSADINHFRNLISGNGYAGIVINNSANQIISGNYIGTDFTGSVEIPNDSYGIELMAGTTGTIVGTDSDGNLDVEERNLISGNGTGVRLTIGSGDALKISGNYIGTNYTGLLPLGNSEDGIEILSGFEDTVIGTNGDGVNDISERNIICANGQVGILLTNTNGITIAGNFIGLGADGATFLGNNEENVFISGTSSNNVVGYNSSMVENNSEITGNKIADSSLSGIVLLGSNSTNNRISRNSFSNNSGLGIDLTNDLVSTNDDGDSDTGENELLNFPVIETAWLINNSLTLTGFSQPGVEIEFYEADIGPNPNPNPYSESFGEGERFLFALTEGSAADTDATSGNYTNDGTGEGTSRLASRFEFIIDVSALNLSALSRLTSLAIDASQNTSEFSLAVRITSAENCTNGLDDDGDGLIDCQDPDCIGSAECEDTDNDDVLDYLDLDDDNDGILDVDELDSSYLPNYTNIGAGSTINNYYNLRTNDFSSSQLTVTNGALNGNQLATIGNIEVNEEFEMTFSHLTDVEFRVGDIPNSYWGANEEMTITVINPLVENDPDNQIIVTQTSNSPLRYLIKLDPASGAEGGNPNLATWTLNTATTYIHGFQELGWDRSRLAIVYGIKEIDSDEDGVFNHLDFDSDNDGIYDLIEAGHAAIDANSDGVIDGSASLFGQNGYLDALETLADSGVKNYTISDSDNDNTINAQELDSDDDGCFDVLEAGFSDNNSDGELGDIPLATDSDGVVTSGVNGYTEPADVNPANSVHDYLEVAPSLSISCSGFFTRTLDNNCEYILEDFTNSVNVTAGCAGYTITQSPPPGTIYNSDQSVTLNYTATDPNGGFDTCSRTLNVRDTSPPMAPALPVIEGQCSVSVTIPIGTDICSGDVTATTSDPVFYDVPGNYTISWTFTDDAGNNRVSSQDIIVQDTTNPDIPTLTDITGECSATATAPSTTDNCDGSITGITTDPLTYSTQGTHTITWTFTDTAGNSVDVTQNVIVSDVTVPTALCQDINLQLNSSGIAELNAADIDGGSFDNCSGVTISISPADEEFTNADLGANTVILTVEDEAGNTSTCQAVVNIIDDEYPNAICQSLTVTLGADGVASINPSDLDGGTTDNGSIVNISASQTTFNCLDLGTITVQVSFEDDAGNVSYCDAAITVIDTSIPNTICQDITILLDIDGSASIEPSDIDGGSFDNCEIVSLNASQTSFDCSNLGQNTVVLTAEDSSGNSSSCNAIVTVADNLNPTAICENITLSLSAFGSASLLPETLDNGSYDNCSISSYSLSQTDFDCSHLGVNSVFLTITDSQGNQSQCEAEVTIIDDLAPVVVECPVDEFYSLDDNCQFTLPDFTNQIEYIDNCSTNGGIVVTQFPLAGAVFNSDTNIDVTLSITDHNSNFSSCEFLVVVTDNSSPIIECIESLEVSTSQDCSYEVQNFEALFTISECSNYTIVQSPSVGVLITEDTMASVEITDENGNSTECEFEIIVTDSSAPLIDCLPNQFESLSPECNFLLPDYGAEINYFAPCNSEITSIVQSPSPGVLIQEDTEVTVEFTDQNGNISTCIFMVFLENENLPLIQCPLDTVIIIEENCQATIPNFLDSILITYQCSSSAAFEEQIPPGGTLVSENTIVRIIATDTDGNTSDCFVNILVEDNTPPEILCPENVYSEESNVEYSLPVVSDNCEAVLQLVSGNESGEEFLHGENEIIYSATDLAGNQSFCSFIITVNTPPVAVEDFVVLEHADQIGTVFSLENDYDLDGDNFDLSEFWALNDSLEITHYGNGNFNIEYLNNWCGIDSIFYVICDDFNACDTGIIHINKSCWTELTIPNGFSPNNDGVNDYLHITGIDQFPNNHLYIFNRWGRQVFEQENYQNQWDGRSAAQFNAGNGLLPEGTYFVVLDLGDGSEIIRTYVFLRH